MFARMVADMQVHASVRGLTRCLVAPLGHSGKAPEVMRYRIAWRAKGLDGYIAPEVGVCHAADTPIWWFSGCRAGFGEEDKQKALEFLKPFGEFLEGRSWVSGMSKGADGAKRIGRYLDKDGLTRENAEDELWENGIRVWDAVAEAQGVKRVTSKLQELKL